MKIEKIHNEVPLYRFFDDIRDILEARFIKATLLLRVQTMHWWYCCFIKAKKKNLRGDRGTRLISTQLTHALYYVPFQFYDGSSSLWRPINLFFCY